jgi:hypothetical protein
VIRAPSDSGDDYGRVRKMGTPSFWSYLGATAFSVVHGRNIHLARAENYPLTLRADGKKIHKRPTIYWRRLWPIEHWTLNP